MLNPLLYDALCRKFRSAGGVRVVNEGVKNIWKTALYGESTRRELVERGEQYCVCCPFCNDTRYRLYLNYEFGTSDASGKILLFASQCFNESCLQMTPELRQTLFLEVLFGRPISKAFVQTAGARRQAEYTPPGDLIPLNRLDPGHLAVRYLADRGFNVQKLAGLYKVAWCTASTIASARSRIIIPVIFDGKEVGWLARLAQDGDFYTDDGRRIPKYYNMPGFQRQRCLYNWDQAKHYKSIVIVEGALDCIRVGGPAVGLLGKSISPQNADRLCSLVAKTGGTLIVALDPDQSAADKGCRHHIEVVADKLRDRLNGGRVMPFYLPTGTDPGGISQKEFQRLLYVAAGDQGNVLEF